MEKEANARIKKSINKSVAKHLKEMREQYKKYEESRKQELGTAKEDI